METERIEKLWQAAMNVASAMLRDGLDTGDAVKNLRDSKVLLNHCKYDEHAHGEELFEVEMEIEAIKGGLMSRLRDAGKAGNYSFDVLPGKSESASETVSKPPKGVPKGKTWARIVLPESMDADELESVEGIDIVERDSKSVTLAGEESSIKKALEKISAAYTK